MPYTILVIDDTKRVLDKVKFFLEQEGYKVKAYQDPDEGLKVAKQGKVDLVLFDIMIPGYDGYKLYELLKSDIITRDTPIIMLTAKAVIMNTPRELFYGLYGFLAKPFTREQLVRIVDDVLKLTKSEEPTKFLRILDEDYE